MPDVPYYPPKTAEGEVGIVDTSYPYGNLRRYGGVPNGRLSSPTNNQDKFHNMIASAKALGVNAFVPKGSYMVSGNVTVNGVPVPTTLHLDGISDLLIEGELGSEIVAADATQRYILLIQNGTNLELRSLRFAFLSEPKTKYLNGVDGPLTRDDLWRPVRITSCKDVIVRECQIRGSRGYGLAFEDCIRPSAIGVVVQDTHSDGINFTSCNQPLADGCTTRHTGDDGIAITTKSTDGPGWRGEGGRIVNCTVRYSASRGIFVSGEHITVANCTIDDTSNAGIAVFRNTTSGIPDPGLQSTSISITGGTIRRAGWGADAGTDTAGPYKLLRPAGPFWFGGGILVAESNGATATENQIHRNVSIMGVAIEAPRYTGITAHGVHGLTIANCPIYKPRESNSGYEFAIFVQKCKQVSVGGCPVTGTEKVAYAVYVDHSEDVSLSPNPSAKPSHVVGNSTNAFWHDGRTTLHFGSTKLSDAKDGFLRLAGNLDLPQVMVNGEPVNPKYHVAGAAVLSRHESTNVLSLHGPAKVEGDLTAQGDFSVQGGDFQFGTVALASAGGVLSILGNLNLQQVMLSTGPVNPKFFIAGLPALSRSELNNALSLHGSTTVEGTLSIVGTGSRIMVGGEIVVGPRGAPVWVPDYPGAEQYESWQIDNIHAALAALRNRISSASGTHGLIG